LANEWYEVFDRLNDTPDQPLKDQVAALRKAAAEIETDEDASRFRPTVMKRAGNDEQVYRAIAPASGRKPDTT
jgi:hypothetical protein